MKCRFHSQCPLYREYHYTCQHDDEACGTTTTPPYCGAARDYMKDKPINGELVYKEKLI